LFDLLVFSDRPAFEEQLGLVQSGRLPRIKDYEAVIAGAASPTPVSLRGDVVRDRNGNAFALRWLLTDITDRKRIEEERTQIRLRELTARSESEAARRMKFLAEAGVVLASSLDFKTIVSSIARLPVPYLADFCAVHLVDEAGLLRQTAAACVGLGDISETTSWEEEAASRALPQVLAATLADDQPRLVLENVGACLSELLGPGSPMAAKVAQLELTNLLLLPLVGHGKPTGTLTLGRSGRRQAFVPSDRDLAVDFMRRCALILDNATLHSQVVVERDKAGKASRAKDEFVAVLSHELRTPLSAILGWLRILKKQAAIHPLPVLRDGVQSLEHNARHIARLVEDCMDVARITERKIQIQRELVDLNQIVKNALDTTREVVSGKNLHFLVHLSSDRLLVFGDRIRLEQVVSNLLSNAARYTGIGGLISVSSQAIGTEAEVSLQDTGIGIEPQLLEQIFEPFQQGTPNWLASESGLGLGLAIARQIMKVHEGRVWAESHGPGTGSTFRLRLPLAPRRALQNEPDALVAASPLGGNRHRILVIEDSADILNLMKIELSELGFDVLTAGNGQSGLEAAYNERPQVIISDIKMPGMDGYEFVKQLRSDPSFGRTPVIALTGFGMKQDIERALAAGYTTHLCKPVEMDQLASLIRKLASEA
jgi:signal transduction histidine kinase/ActR/RegA family two-component response regulator